MKILGVKYLQECIVFQVLIAAKYAITFIYIADLSTLLIYDQFADNLELVIDEVVNNNPFLLIFGNLNVK